MATMTSEAVLFHLLERHMGVPDPPIKGIVGAEPWGLKVRESDVFEHTTRSSWSLYTPTSRSSSAMAQRWGREV